MPQEHATRSSSFPDILRGSYAEEDISAILQGIFENLDTPRRKCDPAGKTVLIHWFGTFKGGKDTLTEGVEGVLRRVKIFRNRALQVYWPRETAEFEAVRKRSTDDMLVFQGIHTAEDEARFLNYSQDRNFHAVLMHRPIEDMLYWYARWVREGKCSELHRESVRSRIYDLLNLKAADGGRLADVSFFVTCSPDEALRREYAKTRTKERGSNMNEKTLAEAVELYDEVIRHLKANVPDLPIFTIDTTQRTIEESLGEVFQHLLPTLIKRYAIPNVEIVSRSPGLLERAARSTSRIEEQLRLRGDVSEERLRACGRTYVKEADHEDTYLNLRPEETPAFAGYFGALARIRQSGSALRLMFKTSAADRIFSHRQPWTSSITPEEVVRLTERYPTIAVIKKHRRYFERKHEGHAFRVHRDAVEGLGEFTEVCCIGSADNTHTEKLLAFSAELGFSPADIVEGAYLTLALRKKR